MHLEEKVQGKYENATIVNYHLRCEKSRVCVYSARMHATSAFFTNLLKPGWNFTDLKKRIEFPGNEVRNRNH